MPWARAGAAQERRQNSAPYQAVVGGNPSSWQELGGPRCTVGKWLDVVGVQRLCDCSGKAQWLPSSRKLGRVQIAQRISSRSCRWTAIQNDLGDSGKWCTSLGEPDSIPDQAGAHHLEQIWARSCGQWGRGEGELAESQEDGEQEDDSQCPKCGSWSSGGSICAHLRPWEPFAVHNWLSMFWVVQRAARMSSIGAAVHSSLRVWHFSSLQGSVWGDMGPQLVVWWLRRRCLSQQSICGCISGWFPVPTIFQGRALWRRAGQEREGPDFLVIGLVDSKACSTCLHSGEREEPSGFALWVSFGRDGNPSKDPVERASCLSCVLESLECPGLRYTSEQRACADLWHSCRPWGSPNDLAKESRHGGHLCLHRSCHWRRGRVSWQVAIQRIWEEKLVACFGSAEIPRKGSTSKPHCGRHRWVQASLQWRLLALLDPLSRWQRWALADLEATQNDNLRAFENYGCAARWCEVVISVATAARFDGWKCNPSQDAFSGVEPSAEMRQSAVTAVAGVSITSWCGAKNRQAALISHFKIVQGSFKMFPASFKTAPVTI